MTRSRKLLVPSRSLVQQPSRNLIRVVQFFQRKWRDFYDEPLRVVYTKDSVSRARHILVYKGLRNIIIPVAGLFALILFSSMGYCVYNVFYAKGYKDYHDYDEYVNYERRMILPLIVGVCLGAFMAIVVARYVTRIYYNESKQLFTLVTYNLLTPWRTQTRVVRAGAGQLVKRQLEPNETDFRILWTCKVDGKKYLIFPECFKYPVYFNVLFGCSDPDAIAKLNDSNETADTIFRNRSKDNIY